MGTTAQKLKKLLDNKRAIRDAITEKTGEDAGDVMSTYAEKILDIEGGGSKYFRTTILLDQTITDPATMITKVYDDGGINQIRLNSHRYVCKLVDGVMEAKQLQDNNGTLYLDGTAADLTGAEGDVMMKLPEFYYRATEQETDKWLIDFVYGEMPDESYKVWDGKDFVGVYEGYVADQKLYSISGKPPHASVANLSSFQNMARNRGDGYTCLKWKHHSIMVFLFYAQYLNTNSQECIGYGSWSTSSKSGDTNLLGMEDTIKNISGEQFTNFWGLERWIDNFSEIIENVYYNNGFCVDGMIIPNVSIDSSDYISKLTIGENLDAACKSVGGTETTGFCDYWTFSSDGPNDLITRAGGYSEGCGIVSIASLQSEPYITSRLAYRGEYEIIG